ncbi:hypothetical protein DPMN_180324 [Dreissena polymorpha]|uniref:Uncharacterized protein n=1 Tax=Dreissena polymorpha TaxID=45954 RepID=A0A9D4ILJ6_DREPO|nr:hypothetical protein DPMN_180324 [Dreissena polymorpha]
MGYQTLKEKEILTRTNTEASRKSPTTGSLMAAGIKFAVVLRYLSSEDSYHSLLPGLTQHHLQDHPPGLRCNTCRIF